jgi:Putative transmembrane protein (PGPGW)
VTLYFWRVLGGFALVLLGIAGLLLPILPGWVFIIPGLGMLPFPWANKLLLWLRRKVPGLPDEGPLPARFWYMLVGCMAVGTTFTILWGDDVRRLILRR